MNIKEYYVKDVRKMKMQTLSENNKESNKEREKKRNSIDPIEKIMLNQNPIGGKKQTPLIRMDGDKNSNMNTKKIIKIHGAKAHRLTTLNHPINIIIRTEI